MTVRVGEMTTEIESVSDVAASAASASAVPREETAARREKARRLAEWAVQIARRTRAEAYDD